MATVGLYGSSSSGVVPAASGAESTGLYGNNVNFGGSYFEWFIFKEADTQPATPTDGSWSFSTNTGIAPTGWSSNPPSAPTNKVWVSIALVNSKNASSLTWSAPGLFSYSSGLPILSGNGTPGSGVGQSDQLYIQLDSTPQTIWFKESGTWTRLTGSSIYMDLTGNQTVAGTKTFSNQIQGSISGTASNVTGTVAIANGGTGATTASAARTALGAAASGANSDITSLSGLTTPLSIAQGGTSATTAGGALTALGAIGSITSTDGSIIVIPSGTSIDLAVSVASPASTLVTPVRNSTGATLTKGTVVYISGATGQIATVSKAIATSDAASAQTLGMITADITNNANGYVTVFGLLTEIDTSAFTDGAQLYLSGTTAGTVTATKPSAPTHLVYVAVVEYSHAVHGKLLVKVQNGYELEELHNVAISSPVTGQTITYNSGTGLWSNSTVSLTAGVNGTLPVLNGGTGVTTSTGSGSVVLSTSPTLVTPVLGTPTSGNFSTGTFTWPTFNQNTTGTASNVTGTVAIANGGTGQTTANAAFNALVPSQVGNSGKYLTTDGTNTSWATNPLGTVTSVGGTGTVNGLTLTGTVTTSGNLTLGGTLDLSSPPSIGNTAANTGAFTTLSASSTVTLSGGTANGVAYLNGSKVLTTGSALTFDGTTFGNAGAFGSSTAALVLKNTSAASTSNIVEQQYWAGNSFSGLVSIAAFGADTTTGTGNQYGSFYWKLANAGAPSEQMRLTSTGLGIGTSSVNYGLTLNKNGLNTTAGWYQNAVFADASGNRGLFFGYDTSGNNVGVIGSNSNTGAASSLQFWTFNGSTWGSRLNIDSSGNLLVGATSSVGGERLNITKDLAGQEVVRFYNTNATNPYGLLVNFSGGTFNNATNYFFLGLDGATPRIYLRSNGGIANYSANNVNLSDRREKTNFAPAKPYLDVICAIPVQTYNYIDQNLKEDPGLTLGVVAQDVQAVAPEFVMESNWGTKEEPKMRLSIYQTDLQYALMKCIQEQQALIQSLTARLDAANL